MSDVADGFVYLAKLKDYENIYKIGHTLRPVETRIKALQKQVGPCDLVDYYKVEVMHPLRLERSLQGIYPQAYRKSPFRGQCSTELFTLSPDEVQSFRDAARAIEDKERKQLEEYQGVDKSDLRALLRYFFRFP